MKKSKVFKLFPKDIEQESFESNQNWLNELKIFFNQLPISEQSGGFAKKSIKDQLFGENQNNSYYYKFYSLNDQIFLETNCQEELTIPRTDLKLVEDTNSLLINLGEVYSDSILAFDYVKINGIYYRLINLYEFSKTLNPSQLMNYGDYCLFVQRLDPEISKRRINTQRKLHHSNLYSHIRNIESEKSFDEAERITESMIDGDESLFKVEAWFIVKAHSEEELTNKTVEIIRSLKQIEAEPLIETEGLKLLFASILFGQRPTFKRSHEPPTSYLVNMIPLLYDRLHNKGLILHSRRINEIRFNLFDESSLNFNILISGQSGSGKSMIAQKILKDAIQNNHSAIVLDLGNSFKKTIRYYGGESLSTSFNPMQFKCPHYLKEFIVSVIPQNELSSKLEGKIFTIISNELEKCQSFKDLIFIIEHEIPDIDLYFSELWEFFDDIERPLSELTYVDTSLYPDKIKAPLIIFLIECFKNLDGNRVFVFDEVWSFLNKNAEYISECFRTFRKHGASAIAISQGVEDFIQTPLGLSIAQTSFTKFYFSQTIVANAQGFVDDFDQDRIKELGTKNKSHSEFYLKSENHRKVIHYYPTNQEYELFTSNYEDNKTFNLFLEENQKYFPFWKTFDRYINFKYLNGVNNE